VAGAAGRLGEALLAEVVSSPRYRGVSVLTEGRLGSTVSGLQGVSLEDLQATPSGDDSALELDVFVCWADVNDPMGRSHNRRDAIYAAVSDAGALRAIALAACGLRARRLLLLAPLLAWQQVSAAGRMLPEAMEMELARLPIPTIVIVRPTTELQRSVPAGASRMQRFARFYLSQLRFMLPAVTHSLRSSDIARAVLSIMADADRPGLAVVSIDDIRTHAGLPSKVSGANAGDKAGEKRLGPEDKVVDKRLRLGDKAADKPADKFVDKSGEKSDRLPDKQVDKSVSKAGDNSGERSVRA